MPELHRFLLQEYVLVSSDGILDENIYIKISAMLLLLSENTVTPKKRSRIIRPGDVPKSISPYTLLVRLFKRPFLSTPREVYPMYPGLPAILQQGAVLPCDTLPTLSAGNAQGNSAPVHNAIYRRIQHADTVPIRPDSTYFSRQVSSETERNTKWNEEYAFHGTILQGQQSGQYRLIRQIGQGGYANIYLGKHIRSNRWVALKLLNCIETNEGEVERFRREAHLHASMRHRHIVPVLDFGWEKDIPFLVMRYAPGGTLQQYFSQGRPFPLHAILPAVLQIASALQYIHNHDLVHCDIKPENVLVGPQNETWLSDFGIATSVACGDRCGTHELRGTARYSAPEQISGNPLPASDQYALAVMMYQWLCGRCPFSGTPLNICFQHLHTPPPCLRDQVPSISHAVEQVVLKALSKDPHRRFAGVLEFAHALMQAVQIERRSVFFASGVESHPKGEFVNHPPVRCI